MSIRPSGVGSASRPCSSSATSCWQRFSASGSFMEILLQQQLGGDRIDRLLLHAAQQALGLDRAEALIDARHGQVKPALELPREPLDPLGERVFALLCHRQADDQLGRAPFGDQLSNMVESRGGDRRQRMRGAELRLADCYSNTL